MSKAIFLDRDGVICEDTNYVTSLSKLKIFTYSRQAVEIIHSKGYKAVVITNQSGVGRGYMTEDDLIEINNVVMKETGVDAIYYCPHYYNKTLETSKYNIECTCRKPKNGLVIQAMQEYQIESLNSYFVGDRESDILAGKRSNLITVLISSHKESQLLCEPDLIYPTLLDFAMSL